MAEDQNKPPADSAPAPFRREEIRAGYRRPRVVRFLVEPTGSDSVLQVWNFEAGDETGVEREVQAFSAAGEPLEEPERSWISFDEMHAQTSFPARTARVRKEKIGLPAGRFDCLVYTVDEGPVERRLWYSRDLPGMPIRLEIRAGGGLRVRTSLIESRIETSEESL